MSGLARGVQLHDPTKGALSTVCYPWIKHHIQRGISREQGVNYREAQKPGSRYTGRYMEWWRPESFQDNAERHAEATGADTDWEDTQSRLADDNYAIDDLLDAIDAARLVASLNLTADDIALLAQSSRETARRLGVSHVTANNRRQRLLAELRTRLAEGLPPAPHHSQRLQSQILREDHMCHCLACGAWEDVDTLQGTVQPSSRAHVRGGIPYHHSPVLDCGGLLARVDGRMWRADAA